MADQATTAQPLLLAGAKKKSFRQILGERIATLQDVAEKKARGEEVHLSIPTGLRAWDEVGGIERGVLTTIGAATGDGKSIVALHLATAAAKHGYKVLLLSFEDPVGKTADRTLSAATGLDNKTIGKAELDDFDMGMLISATKDAAWAENIDVCAGLRDAEAVMKIIKEGGYDLILVDYAQAFPEMAGMTMENTIRRFSLEVNAIAQTQNSAIIIFSQLKGDIDVRGRKQWDNAKYRDPKARDVSAYCPSGLTDVAWAKALADQSKYLLYIWRPYRMLKKLTGDKSIRDNRLRIIAGKANFAGEDDLEFEFDGPTATIRDLEK